jgi:hypothetical protein
MEVKANSPSVNLGPDRTIVGGQSTVLTATVSSGRAPFIFSWSNNLGSNPTATVSAAGTYTVTVTDANGCTASDNIVITSNSGCTLEISVTQNNAFCFGSTTGSIFVGYVNGGVAPYQYSFDGGLTFSNIPNKYNVIAGAYTIVVKDAGNCTGTKTVIITEGSKINFTATPTSNCSGNGSITFSNVSGGNGSPYQFLITNLPFGHPYAGTWVTNMVFNNLPPNTYFVTVRDASGCSAQPPIAVVVGSTSGISATITGNSTVCFGGTTPITANVTGGSAPYSYAWIKPDASAATTQSLQGGVGNFFVTVTDASGCTGTAMKTISGVNGVTAAITGNTTLCTSTSTTLTATGWEGTPPYNVTWSTGKTGTTNNNTTGISITVGAGNYCVTITDANGCSSTLCKTVTASTLAVAVNTNQAACSSSPATLTAAATFGLAPYAYNWSNGSTTSVITVGAGTYTVTVTDAGGCTVSKAKTVAPSSPLTLTLDSTKNISCSSTVGKISTTLTGGSGAKSFTNNNFNTSQSSPNFSNLTAGFYTIQAKDANGCLSNTVSATISQQTSLVSVNTTNLNVSCNNGNNGAITIYAANGVLPYSYSKNNGSSWQTASVFSNLSANSYAIKVRDANGCTSTTQTITLTQPAALTFSTVKEDPTCNGSNDGRITVRNITGGNGGPFQFSKDNGASWQADSVFRNLIPATYSIKIRDYYSCTSSSRTIVVAQPANITFATTVGNVTCGFSSNGIIGVNSLTGGTAPYQYSRGSAYQTSANFTGLIVGNYPVRVKDANGCLSAVANTAVTNICATITPLLKEKTTLLIPIIVMNISPNPATDDITLAVQSLNKRVQQFDFVDILGKTHISEKHDLEAGVNRLSFDVSALPQGTYFIQTLGTGEGRNQRRKFVKM